MGQKLFAGVEDIIYEYAGWAHTSLGFLVKVGRVSQTSAGDPSNNTFNKALKKIITDKTKLYRRKLVDGAEWEMI